MRAAFRRDGSGSLGLRGHGLLAGFGLGLLALAGLATTTQAGPAPQVATVGYAISLGGLPIGQAELKGTVEGSRYKVDLNVQLTGLAGILTGGRGNARASGTLSGARVTPTAFAVLTKTSSAEVLIRMALASGNVKLADVQPPPEPKPDRVPLEAGHKRGVIDPASALLMPVAARANPLDPAQCNRTLPVFDGWTRFNVVLSYAETREVEKPGYRGPVLVCNARYRPIAGHRSDRPATQYMENNTDMSVWLAPMEGAGLLVPLRIAVMTQMGTNIIEAQSWSVTGAPSTATPGHSLRRRSAAAAAD